MNQPGSPTSSGWFVANVPGTTGLYFDVQFNYSTLNVTFDSGYNWTQQYWCTYTFGGSVSGTVTGMVNGLTFSGVFEDGSSEGTSTFDAFLMLKSSDFWGSFHGFWSDGMYSTGTLGEGEESWQANGTGGVGITTTAPEPSNLVLLATGLVPIIGGIRHKLWR